MNDDDDDDDVLNRHVCIRPVDVELSPRARERGLQPSDVAPPIAMAGKHVGGDGSEWTRARARTQRRIGNPMT